MSRDREKSTNRDQPNRDQRRNQGPAADGHPENAADGLVEIEESAYRALQKELADYKDKYVRLCAEFENIRKRQERERFEFVKYASEGVIVEFLGILDDLERSVQAANNKHQDYNAFLKGVELVMAHIYELLKKHNVQPIEAVGKKFDPHCHEILMQAEAEGHEEGMVLEEFQKGYVMGDRVVRTSKVKVAVHTPPDKPHSAPAAEEPQDS